MKKLFALLMAALICFSLAACDLGTDDGTTYKLGDTVSTDIFEFTLHNAQFTVALNNVTNNSYFTPKEYNAKDDSNNPYVAPVGHTYAALSYTVTNLDRASGEFHTGSFATVKYDGKKYSALKEGAYYLYEDKLVADVNGNVGTEEGAAWYRNPGSNFLLMAGEKQTRRAYIDLSISVQDLTEDVTLTVQIPNSAGKKVKFTYVVTEADRLAHGTTDVEMTLETAARVFTEDEGLEYFAAHMDEYPVVSGDQITGIVSGEWDVDYIIEGMGYWSGTFWFEEGGVIRDDYGYTNERTWAVDGDTLIINGDILCEMRAVADHMYLLVSNGKPYMLMQ